MLEADLLNGLESAPTGPVFKLWGIGESVLVDLMREKGTLPPDLEWGTIARPEGITMHFDGSFLIRDDAERLIANIKKDLGPYIVAEKDISPVERLAEVAQERGITLGTAESCTGGLLSEKFTSRAGSSSYFLGSVVSYSNSVKHSVLGVKQDTLETHGAVSEETALEMARGALKALGVDLSMAITGIAGPDGGSVEKPVGTVHMAVAHRDGWTRHRLGRFGGDRGDIRERSAQSVCSLALEGLSGRE